MRGEYAASGDAEAGTCKCFAPLLVTDIHGSNG
jgi:hypothetical protein